MGLLLAAIMAVIVMYLAGSFQGDLFDADHMYLPILFREVLANDGGISNWYLPPAPYFFPDYFVFSMAYRFGGDTFSQIIWFSVLQILVTFGSVLFLVGKISRKDNLLLSSLITILLIWLAATAESPFVLLLESAFHYGSYISSIVFCALWIRYCNGGYSLKGAQLLTGMSLLAFVSALSDNIFLIQVLIPFLVTCLFFNFINRKFTIKNSIFIFTPVIFGGLGSLSYGFLVAHDTRNPVDIGLNNTIANIHDWFFIIKNISVSIPFYGFLFICYLGFCLICISRLVTSCGLAYRDCFGLPKELTWLLVYSFTSLFSVFFAFCFISSFIALPRYIISNLSWPIIVMTLVVHHFSKERFYYFGIFASAIVVTLLCVDALKNNQSKTFISSYYPDQISCIDNSVEKAGLTDGVAQYFDAKHIQAFSKLKINLAQYDSDLNEYRWITSSNFFKSSYDFAIISESALPPYKIPAQMIIAINGEPEKRIACGDRTLLIYGKGKLLVKNILNPGDSYEWQACELSTLTGVFTTDCLSERMDSQKSGHLTIGPYETLPSGKYFFEIEYLSPGIESDVAGEWDIVFKYPFHEKLLAKGALTGSNTKVKKISSVFAIDQDHNMEKIGIRTVAHQGVAMRINKIQIKRLE